MKDLNHFDHNNHEYHADEESKFDNVEKNEF
jgi:hypothetical protein